MSTLSGVSQKGEKGKSKFQSLDINNLYNKSSRGESSEPHQQKSSLPRKHGMQSLGKIPSRRPPVNLPSLKSEHSGNDPTVSLVPSGGTGWGSKPGETGPSPSSQPTPQPPTSPATSTNLSANAPVAAVTTAQPTNTQTTSQTPAASQSVMKQILGTVMSTGDKTWSSVMSGVETGPSFLAHQSPQFQQEFPSLSGEGGAQVPPGKGGGGGSGSGGGSDAYGPGPSLRPQTEGSWIQGGGIQTTSTIRPQHPFLPQESAQGSSAGGAARSNLAPYGAAAAQGGQPAQPTPLQTPQQTMGSQFKGVVPPFMLKGVGFSSPVFPSGNFQNSIRPPRFNNPPPENNRYMQGRGPHPMADPEDLVPRPIIREEDLTRMDEISRESGWANQDDIDYNQKLTFSDDECGGAEDGKESKEKTRGSASIMKDDKKDVDGEKENKVHHVGEKHWHSARGPNSLPSSDFRGPIPIRRDVDDEIMWRERRKQTSDNLAAVSEKAKQRKEEEEKRFEESRSKSFLEHEKMKRKEPGHDSHSSSSAPEWDKDDKPSPPAGGKDPDAFRQITQIESRNSNFSSRNERDSHFAKVVPPRFMKQMNSGGSQSFTRPSSGGQSEARWNSGHYQAKIGNRRETDNLDRDGGERVFDEDKERRERQNSESNVDRDRYRANTRSDRTDIRKNNYYDGPSENRSHHRDYDHNDRERPKETDYRLRDRDDFEWENRRVNSAWDNNRHYDDRNQGRRDPKKPSDTYHKPQTSFFDENERDRSQRPESRDRPARPDSRDSRTSRDSRASRDSIREESRSIPEVTNDNSWNQISDYEKDIRDEKPRKRDSFKEDKRENQTRRDGYVPGPITREKLEAYEHKQKAKTDKKEIINTSLNCGNTEEESWSKLQSGTGNQAQGGSTWGETGDEGTKPSDSTTVDDSSDKTSKEDLDKKKDFFKDKERSLRGGRGGRGGRQQGHPSSNTGSYNTFYQRNNSNWNQRDTSNRRGPGKVVSKGQSHLNGSESEGSADEISVSTESGKEDKKDRQQALRSEDRKKDKDDRNSRESKKSDSDKSGGNSRQDRKHFPGGTSYDSGRKEGFAPRGEPSRRGRGGFRSTRGNIGKISPLYGPPGNKSPFPSSQPQLQPFEQSKMGDEGKPSDLTTEEDKHKSHPSTAGSGGSNRQSKESRKGSEPKRGDKGSGGEEWETTSEGSTGKGKSKSRPVGDKRFSTAHMNGRPRPDTKDNFQDKNKKMGKDSKEDLLKRNRGKDGKGAPKLQPGSGPGAKATWGNNKPPRILRLENTRKQQQQQQQEVSDMNKMNQSVSLFPAPREANSTAPAPPPSVNAWDKPITAALRTTPPPVNSLHMAATINNAAEKAGIDLTEHVQSGGSSQTSSPSTDKTVNKLTRDVDKGLLDGTTPPVQTIIFENTNFKGTPGDMAMKSKYNMKGPRMDKGRGKLDEEMDGISGMGTFKADLKPGDKQQEALQIQMAFNKSEDSADMKLDFPYDSDLSQLTEDNTNISRSLHLGQASAADLGQKIASVKKVWDQHGGVDETHVVSTSSSSFTPNFGETGLVDHTSSHPVDDVSFSNTDVYSPGMQSSAGSYSSGSGNIMKQDPNNSNSNVRKKPQPQQATVISSAIGTQSLSSPPPTFNQPSGHFNHQVYQYGSIPAIPSPPAVIMNPQGGQQVASHQGELYPFPLTGALVGNTQRSSYNPSYNPYNISPSMNQQSAFNQQSLYHMPTQGTPANPPPEVFSSFRIQPSYGQSQQLNSNPSTVLITSSSNSLMSASVKSSPQPPLGAIGTKGGYQSNAVPSQVPLSFIPYDQLMPQSYLQTTPIVQTRHAGGNVAPTIQPPTSYYSNSTGGQTTLFQASSMLAGTGSQGLHNATYGMQGFNTQSGSSQSVPSSSATVGLQSYAQQMGGHFRNPTPTYIKTNTGQHQPDASKSPSTNQDVLNSVFAGNGQIPSPKSRTGGNGGNSGGKQVPQQPSPTQSHHKYSSYQSQQNLVSQGQRSGQIGGGVRNVGLGANGVAPRYPPPIQRPPGAYQHHHHQQQMLHAMSQQHPRPKLSTGRQQHQHIKSSGYYLPQSNNVKIDTTLENKGDADKLQDGTSTVPKPDSVKEEKTTASE